MIRCDVWLCNPPYNGNKNKANCLHVSIAKHIKKKKIERFIQVSPIVAQMKYKTAEYIGNPFGIRWSNIFIFDMLGNENEYFSQNKMPLWDKTSNKCIWLEGEGYNQKVILCDINKNNAKTRYKIKDWLKREGFDQTQVGLSKIDNFRDCFKVYLDHLKWSKDNPPNHRFDIEIDDRKYRGIIGESGNEPRLSEIEKYMISQWFGILYFNREAYSVHCREYKEYQKWLKERNEDRVAVNEKHGQQFDSKNIMHLVRLINEAEDIAINKNIIVDRSFERDYLLSIKQGKVDLKDLINQYEEKSNNLKELFDKSNLPDKCELNLNELEYKLRDYDKRY